VQIRILQPSSFAIDLSTTNQETIEKKHDNTHVYLLILEELAVIPTAKEKIIATIVHSIPSSNHAIYLQWPL
jgi:hypothetical protein